ncbi:MAG TPA: ATP-binding protein [Firmicutes bacterium]|nr:ATP-binding protein [Candidatus Fermentithermobacillaceae bacterium]
MTEISLHLLDVLENSAKAGATRVRVFLGEDDEGENLILEVEDDGRGMSPDEVSRAFDPFFTTTPGKKVGLGLALLRSTAEAAGGRVRVQSASGKGTVVTATFKLRSVDRPPLGDVPGTLETFMICHPGIELDFTWKTRKGSFHVNSRQEIPPCSRGSLAAVTALTEKLSARMKDAGFQPDQGGFDIEIKARS